MTGGSGALGRDRASHVEGARRDLVRLGLLAFGLYHLALGVLMVTAPGLFFEVIGPFGERNDHYTRDAATFTLAFGAVALIALRRERWRAPVLTVIAVQFVLHAVNHLVDIDAAEPPAAGPIDFALLALGASVASALAVRAWREEGGS